jgi:hypothetical protein
MPKLSTPQRQSRERRTKGAIIDWNEHPERYTSKHQCARAWGLDPVSFNRRLAGGKSSTEAQDSLLSKASTHALVNYLVFIANRGFPATLQVVQSTAQEMLAMDGLPTYIGCKWAQRFVKKQPRLCAKYSRSLDAVRASKNNNLESLKGWFELLKETVDTYEITPERTYNMDETGFMTGVITSSSKVVVEAVVKEPSARRMPSKATITQPGNREWVTVIQAVGADGRVIDPFVIIKGQIITRSFASNLLKALPAAEYPYAKVTYSDNGWTDASIAVQWLQGFIEQTAPPCNADGVMPYRLLIIDGHSSHTSLQFIQLAELHRVIVLCFPAHSTHLLQPLDVVCFAPLKKRYSQLLTAERARPVNRDDFIHLYAEAQKVFTPALVQKSFESTGIWPYNPSKVLTLPQVRAITPPPPRRPAVATPIEDAESFTPSTAARLLRRMADDLEVTTKSKAELAQENGLLRRKVAQLSAENKRKQSRQVEHGRAAVDTGKVLSSVEYEALEREKARALEEADAVKAVKQRRKDTVANSAVLIKALKQRRAASKKEVTRLQREYNRAAAALKKLRDEASKPRSKAARRSQSQSSQPAPTVVTITAQQQRVNESASQLEDEREFNATVHAKLQRIEEILVAIRTAKNERLSLQSALDHMDFLLKETSDKEIVQRLAADALATNTVYESDTNDEHESLTEFNTELGDELGNNTDSDDFDEGDEEDEYSQFGLQYPPASPSYDLWEYPQYPSSPLNRLGSEVPDSQDNEILG